MSVVKCRAILLWAGWSGRVYEREFRVVSTRYLVTGGTGLLGNNVVRSLVQDGHQVRVLLRNRRTDPSLDGLPVEIVEGDVLDVGRVLHAAKEVNYIVHSAADVHIGWRRWEQVRAINVNGTRNVAIAAMRASARMVHVSTVDTLAASDGGSPVDENAPVVCKVPCTYCVTKREAEQVVHQHVGEGLDAVIVHPGFMLGPYDWKPSSGRILQAVARGAGFFAPIGGMSGCDVRDVAAGIVSAATNGQTGRNYILAGENISYKDAWRLFAKVTGGPSPRIRMGPLVRLIAGRGGDLFNTFIPAAETDLNSAMIRMSSLLNYYSSSRARAELGYKTRPFEQAVTAAWQWMQQKI